MLISWYNPKNFQLAAAKISASDLNYLNSFCKAESWPKGCWGQGQVFCHWPHQTLYLVLCKKLVHQKLQNAGWYQTQCLLSSEAEHWTRKQLWFPWWACTMPFWHSTEAPEVQSWVLFWPPGYFIVYVLLRYLMSAVHLEKEHIKLP